MSLPELTGDPLAVIALIVFAVAYLVVASEEYSELSKSKPMVLAAGIIWILVTLIANKTGLPELAVEDAIEETLHDYAALFLFLLVAMTYINAMSERNIFGVLRRWLLARSFSYRGLFWLTGLLGFISSPVADNLTTALLMGTVVMSLGQDNPRFVQLGCINIVVAANAGGAFSPFGDITTLMVWQSGKVPTLQFLLLLVPAVVSFLIPALFMHVALPSGHPPPIEHEDVRLKPGALGICLLFLLTLVTAVTFEQALNLPAFLGMMTGFALLMFYAYHLKLRDGRVGQPDRYNIFQKVAQAEWDTLLFFFGVLFCVAGLGFLGYLAQVSEATYGAFGPLVANVLAGLFSAIVDNIPVVFAVLEMNPAMDETQWLLITLTTGIGGSLLSIGSAAGVALMGQSAGRYTFFGHLRWSWAVLLGYAAGIGVHLLLSG